MQSAPVDMASVDERWDLAWVDDQTLVDEAFEEIVRFIWPPVVSTDLVSPPDTEDSMIVGDDPQPGRGRDIDYLCQGWARSPPHRSTR